MAEGSSSGDFEQLLECPLCLEQCRNPRGLPCQHVFCLPCLEDLIQSSDWPNRINCPSCREDVHIPAGGASGFPIAYLVNKLSEVVRKQKISRPKQIQKCSRHGRPVEMHCDTCHNDLCIQCLSQHGGHTILSLEDLRARLTQPLLENKDHLSKRVKEYEAHMQKVNGSKVKYQQNAEKQMTDLEQHGKKIIDKVNRGITEMKDTIRIETEKVIREFENLEASMTSEMAQLYQHIDDIEGVLDNPDQPSSSCYTNLDVYKRALQQHLATHAVPEKSTAINFADIGQLTTKLLIGEVQMYVVPATRPATASAAQTAATSRRQQTPLPPPARLRPSPYLPRPQGNHPPPPPPSHMGRKKCVMLQCENLAEDGCWYRCMTCFDRDRFLEKFGVRRQRRQNRDGNS